MVSNVYLDEMPIKVLNYDEEYVEQSGIKAKKMVFDFEVTSKDYHAITTMLYKMSFDVKIPDISWYGRATITNYSSSFTNLYEENQVGVFHLELLEDL